MAVKFFQEARAIESLRESDFDTVSAYGEVLDNSLEAGASEVKVKFVTETRANGYEQIQAVAFGDNGTGMDDETLHNCLTVGWSSRYNSRSGIGRFGVGMTLGAIHECKRVEIWTKLPGGTWKHTYLDLDEIADGALTTVPEPAARPVPDRYVDLVGEHGTLVVWKHYDRQPKTASEIRRDFDRWCGRTYRYFIWGDVPGRKGAVRFDIDGQTVRAIDPLYHRTKRTRYPEDPKAELYPPMELKWPVDANLANAEGRESIVTIRMSCLPEELRARKGDGGSREARARFIDWNEGISIMRNHREVFYGPIPYWKSTTPPGWAGFENIDRWWGCEVLFDADLDRSFQVKNIKRGAVPVRQLKLALKELILPTRQTVLKNVRELWSKTKAADDLAAAAEAAEKSGVPRAGDHGSAEKVAKTAPVPNKDEVDKNKNLDAEATRQAETYAERYDEEQRRRLAELFKSQPFTIMEESWRGPQFFEPHFLGGSAVLDYNMRHDFFVYLNSLLQDLESECEDPVALAREIRAMIDLLIISHAKAEAQFGADATYTSSKFLEFLQSYWGQFLTSYVASRRMTREET